MPYQFPPDIAQWMREQMATDGYQSEDDLLRAALQALNDRAEDLAAIQAGIDDMHAGRMRPLREVDDAIRKRLGFSAREVD